MQTFNNFNEFVAGTVQPHCGVSVFNGRARLDKIHAIIKQTNSGDVRKNPELAKLVDEEIQYWKQQDKSKLTDEQRRTQSDWELMYDYIRRESGMNMTIDDCFSP